MKPHITTQVFKGTKSKKLSDMTTAELDAALDRAIRQNTNPKRQIAIAMELASRYYPSK